jgi:NinB protein
MEKRIFFLNHSTARNAAMHTIAHSPEGWKVTIEPPKRSGEQNSLFHALCGDIARSGMTWLGKPRTGKEWKVLLVSGHAVATKEEAEIVPGLEGEFVNIRESTASMGKKRGSSLIEYTLAFCAENGIKTG